MFVYQQHVVSERASVDTFVMANLCCCCPSFLLNRFTGAFKIFELIASPCLINLLAAEKKLEIDSGESSQLSRKNVVKHAAAFVAK